MPACYVSVCAYTSRRRKREREKSERGGEINAMSGDGRGEVLSLDIKCGR